MTFLLKLRMYTLELFKPSEEALEEAEFEALGVGAMMPNDIASIVPATTY